MSKIYYRGQSLFLYAKFKDENKQSIDFEESQLPVANIANYNSDGSLKLIETVNLIKLKTGEYYANYTLGDDIEYAFYEIEYVGEYLGKTIQIIEDFHVIPRSENFSDAVKIYGYVHQARVGYPLIGASVKIYLPDESKIVYESFTNYEGKWEAYIYPDNYKFIFEKYGFLSHDINAQIGTEHNEIQFDNVTLESESFARKGNGIYTISDEFVTREGTPLNGLDVKAFNVEELDADKPTAEDKTNDDGQWQLFLDPGLYFLRINGTSLMDEFEQTFRLRVEEDGQFSMESLTENIGTPVDESLLLGPGDPNDEKNILVSDSILDNKGNPIIDVQVCVYNKSDLNTLIAQDYTNPEGKWVVYVPTGNYVFEFYHPEFHEFQEERKV